MVQTKTQKIIKVSDKSKPEWLKTGEKDIETIIIKLAKQNLTSEKIGLVLRDSYGIPRAKLLGKRINEILKAKNLYKDSDLSNLEKKQLKIKKHLEKNKQDKNARRAFIILSARIKKLKEYRKKKSK